MHYNSKQEFNNLDVLSEKFNCIKIFGHEKTILNHHIIPVFYKHSSLDILQ